MGIKYRLRQFWRAITAKKDLDELERASQVLSTEQKMLFDQLQPSEKAHALSMLRSLRLQGETQPDLLIAALLHDIGKLRYRMTPIQRAMVVLAQTTMPTRARRWGELPPNGWDRLPAWRKAFVVAVHHAEWGAEMARKVGVSHLTEYLIREHHHPNNQAADGVEVSLLHKLWLADNES